MLNSRLLYIKFVLIDFKVELLARFAIFFVSLCCIEE